MPSFINLLDSIIIEAAKPRGSHPDSFRTRKLRLAGIGQALPYRWSQPDAASLFVMVTSIEVISFIQKLAKALFSTALSKIRQKRIPFGPSKTKFCGTREISISLGPSGIGPQA